jgi:hypothetical protein
VIQIDTGDAFPVEATSGEAHLAPEQKRSLFCPQYNACLHMAAVRDWRDWSCRACPRREDTRPDLHAFATDRRRGGEHH